MFQKLIDRFLIKQNEYNPLLLDFYVFLRKRSTGKKHFRISDNTIYTTLNCGTSFMKFIKLDITNCPFPIETSSVHQFLDRIRTKDTYYQRLRHFFRFCFNNGYITHEKFKILDKMDVPPRDRGNFTKKYDNDNSSKRVSDI